MSEEKPFDFGLRLRPAHPGDLEQVTALCQALDPHDWLPEVFPEWAARQDGTLAVATAEEQVVGILGYALITPHEAYLMGMRVHPNFHRLGIGKALTRCVTDQAGRAGARVARLTTRRDNRAAQALLDATGYSRLGSWDILPDWDWMTAMPPLSASAAPSLEVRQARLADLEWLKPWVLEASRASDAPGLIAQPGETFEVMTLTGEGLASYVEAGEGWLAGPPGFPPNRSAVALLDRRSPDWILRQFTGSLPAATRLLAELDGLIRKAGQRLVNVTLPGSQFARLVEAGLMGYEPAWWPAYVYQWTKQDSRDETGIP
ncbi:MAG: GNAT family N-acetyltransferase [Bacillota bacterium]